MPGITINLTDEQWSALEKRHQTDNLQDTMQKYIEGRADRFIKEEYVKAASQKSLEELKTIFPSVKIEREEPKKEV